MATCRSHEGTQPICYTVSRAPAPLHPVSRPHNLQYEPVPTFRAAVLRKECYNRRRIFQISRCRIMLSNPYSLALLDWRGSVGLIRGRQRKSALKWGRRQTRRRDVAEEADVRRQAVGRTGRAAASHESLASAQRPGRFQRRRPDLRTKAALVRRILQTLDGTRWTPYR